MSKNKLVYKPQNSSSAKMGMFMKCYLTQAPPYANHHCLSTLCKPPLIALPALQTLGGRLSSTIHAEDRDRTDTPLEEMPLLNIQ